MAAMNFLKKAAYWPAVFLCILSIGGASVSPGYQPVGSIHSTPAQSPQPAPPNVSGEVTASWYGPRHHNKLTANGQRFNMYKNTLAHRTLPLGTKVLLVNLDNGKSAEGVVNDRGPYIKSRDVDVSYAMAKQLGFVKKGVMRLDLEMI
jgi:rare lipoprotein A (peptidoglycan hydrolase)